MTGLKFKTIIVSAALSATAIAMGAEAQAQQINTESTLSDIESMPSLIRWFRADN